MAVTTAQPRKGRPQALINPDSCTGCEVFVAVCPVDCIDTLPGPEHPGLNATCIIDQPRCIGCWLCEKICPWAPFPVPPPRGAPVCPPPLPGAAGGAHTGLWWEGSREGSSRA